MRIVAHRGRSGDDPENCIESLSRLTPGVDGVEVDVRVSRDRIPVVIHDERVDRVTGQTGLVAAFSSGELSRLELGKRVVVPTLEDYLDACLKMDVREVFLDIKVEERFALESIVAVVEGASGLGNTVCLGRSKRIMQTLRQRSESLRLGLFGTSMDNVLERLRMAEGHDVELLFVRHGDSAYEANREVVAEIIAAGRVAGASVLNTDKAFDMAGKDGCKVVLTDRRDLFKVCDEQYAQC